jgi:hypothetical protein
MHRALESQCNYIVYTATFLTLGTLFVVYGCDSNLPWSCIKVAMRKDVLVESFDITARPCTVCATVSSGSKCAQRRLGQCYTGCALFPIGNNKTCSIKYITDAASYSDAHLIGEMKYPSTTPRDIAVWKDSGECLPSSEFLTEMHALPTMTWFGFFFLLGGIVSAVGIGSVVVNDAGYICCSCCDTDQYVVQIDSVAQAARGGEDVEVVGQEVSRRNIVVERSDDEDDVLFDDDVSDVSSVTAFDTP